MTRTRPVDQFDPATAVLFVLGTLAIVAPPLAILLAVMLA